MHPLSIANIEKKENWLFLKRWLKHPLRMGAMAPSAPALIRLITDHVPLYEDKTIIEIGGGTGRLTRSLLAKGVDPNRLIVVELDPELCRFLKQSLPQVNVIEGNAQDLPRLIAPHLIGKIPTIVSGIPMIYVPDEIQDKIMKSCFEVLASGGDFLQFTYGPASPVPAKRLGLSKEVVGRVFFNLPPAALWRYRRLEDVVLAA